MLDTFEGGMSMRHFFAKARTVLKKVIWPAVPWGAQGHMAVPSQPVVLPPDGELKRLRVTPVHALPHIPRGQIVELSLDEVQQLYAEGASQSPRCPQCGGGPQSMFWYQYGLVPNFSKEAGVFMRCQTCGHDDYV